MSWLRSWWPQIAGVVVVVGFLGWLVVAGGRGLASGGPNPSPSASATPTAQQLIEKTVKDFVVAYDLSAKTEDPSAAQAFTQSQSPAEGEATHNSDYAKMAAETFVVDANTWNDSSWTVGASSEKATASGTRTETGHWATAPALVQKEPQKTVTIHWTSKLSLIGGRWLLTDFQETVS